MNFAENLSRLMLAHKMNEKYRSRKSLTRISSDQNLLDRMQKESTILNTCVKDTKSSISKELPTTSMKTQDFKRQETISSNFGSSGHTGKPDVESATGYSV